MNAEGEHIKMYGLNFFISKTNKSYSITEGRSGLSAGTGSTKQETINMLKENIKRIGIDRLKVQIENHINRHGISPKYRDVV